MDDEKPFLKSRESIGGGFEKNHHLFGIFDRPLPAINRPRSGQNCAAGN